MGPLGTYKFCLTVTEFPRWEKGQALTEYAVILLLVAIVAIGASTALGVAIVDVLVNAVAALKL